MNRKYLISQNIYLLNILSESSIFYINGILNIEAMFSDIKNRLFGYKNRYRLAWVEWQ